MVDVFFADGFEEIEALTIVDVLRRAEIETRMVSIMGSRRVVGAHGVVVEADVIFKEAGNAPAEMLVLPGGMPGAENLMNFEPLNQELVRYSLGKKWLAAICAAPMVLGQKGLLDGKDATCYPGFAKYLKGANVTGDRVVVSDKVVTAKGPGCATEFALKLVEVLRGEEAARSVASGMLV